MATFHVAMFPWFAMGHLLTYLRLSNKLAEKGHSVSFLLPTNTQSFFHHLNLHPSLITFIPLVVPHVQGLPIGTETMSDISFQAGPLLATALDLMQQQVKEVLHNLNPQFVFYDFAYWIPKVISDLEIKPILYSTVVASIDVGKEMGYSFPSWIYSGSKTFSQQEYGIGITFLQRIAASVQGCDSICFRGCHEIEGPSYEALERKHGKQVLVTGPLLDDPTNFLLEERWDKWLRKFPEHSVIYCAFGSECVITKKEFQELVLGLELTGLPFLVALKVPKGVESMEEALPEGFQERVRGRGVAHAGWVQQKLILNHPSVGCFLSHCGGSSMWESLVSDCQIVALPQAGDQFMNAELMTNKLKVALEVERRDNDGWFTREGVCKAVEAVMNPENELGRNAKVNHAIWKGILLKKGFESNYLNNFITKLQDMLQVPKKGM